MKTETVVLKVEKTVNDDNEIQPNLYTVIENDVILFTTHDAVYALQAVLNRSWMMDTRSWLVGFVSGIVVGAIIMIVLVSAVS